MRLREIEKAHSETTIECVLCQIDVKPWQTAADQYGLCDA